MTFMKFWKRQPALVEEPVEDEASIARVLLEVKDYEVFVSALDEYGCVTKSVSLGLLAEPNDLKHAEQFARTAGWITNEDWFQTGGSNFVDLLPAPLTVAFAGGLLEEEDALRYARTAGLEVIDVVAQNLMENEGRNYVAFSVAKPRKWSW